MTRRVVFVMVLGGFVSMFSGCLYAPIPETISTGAADSATEASGYTEDLVLAVFALDAEFGSETLLDDMAPVEEQAMEALEDAGAGYIDGNEIGRSEYALYFYGTDRGAMWKLLEPILEDAPIPLTRVELWPPGEAAEPTIIEFAPQSQR